MIPSVELEASAALQASRLMFEPLAGSITIGNRVLMIMDYGIMIKR